MAFAYLSLLYFFSVLPLGAYKLPILGVALFPFYLIYTAPNV